MYVYQDAEALESHQELWLHFSPYSRLAKNRTCRWIFGFAEGWEALVPSPCMSRVLRGEASAGSSASHRQNPQVQAGPACCPCTFGLSAALRHHRDVPTTLQGHPLLCPLPEASQRLRGTAAAGENSQLCQAGGKGIKQITTNDGNCLLNILHFLKRPVMLQEAQWF